MVTERLPFRAQRDSDEGVMHVNVGGLRRSVCRSALKNFPDTRLGKLLECDTEEDILQVCDDYDGHQKEFYFDRNPGLFPYVLNFYQTGKLHIMEELCIFSFSQELEYWGISDFFLDSCCSFRYHDRKLESSQRRSWDDDSDASSLDTLPDEISDLNRDMQHFQEVRCGNIRKCLWLTLENPGYSIPSKLFSLLSISVVLTSISTMCINSIPEYQMIDSEGNLMDDPTMHTLEVLCMCWFTFEVVMRLLLAPNRKRFFQHPLNIIDMASILPVYITLVCDMVLGTPSELGDLGRIIQVFRLMRIFRVLKLARHSTGLRSLGATLRHSYREVGILLLYLAVGVSVFSGMAYTAEYEEDVGLDTIPACWWWGTVTMTTVGYGDVVPVTVPGKLAASGCILGGTLVVALPITIIFNKFSHFYRRQKALEASVRNGNSSHRRRKTPSCGDEEGQEGAGSDDNDVQYEDDGGGVINYSYVEAESRQL
uniref:potassium voltage-gated channel subfamily S member 1 n=1 Tax=Doryrhamphus excisus TaxID=161450 RepID=UPI0025ADDD54|nr:potassium voltage-gated channel subfamily S member 1 [Doryrhamphus excisus]